MNEQRRAAMHHALADAHRARIVDELERHPGGLDASELARVLGVHPNTARWHLGVLAGADLVASHPGERTGPGRPRIVFTLAARGGRENYRLLATMLVSTLSAVPDAAERLYETGRAWGRYLLPRLRPGKRPSRREATRLVADLLGREGFRPEVTGLEIRMHGCPFRELARQGEGLVCRLHAGLIAGALAEIRDDLHLDRLDPFVEPQLCVARLAHDPSGENGARPDDRREIAWQQPDPN